MNSDDLRKLIDEKTSSLSTFEKSEFDMRYRKISNAIFAKNNLTKESNTLQEAYQSELRHRKRNEIKFCMVVVLLILIGYFFDFTKGNEINLIGGLILVATVVVYEIKKEIFDAKYFILKRKIQYEIERYKDDMYQYGVFIRSEIDLTFEYVGDNEDLLQKFREDNLKARFELQLEILKYMKLNSQAVQW